MNLEGRVLERVELPDAISDVLLDEMLSVAADADHAYALVTNPSSGHVIAVGLRDGSYATCIDVHASSAVYDDKRGVFVVAGSQGLYEAANKRDVHFKPDFTRRMAGDFEGSHSVIITL